MNMACGSHRAVVRQRMAPTSGSESSNDVPLGAARRCLVAGRQSSVRGIEFTHRPVSIASSFAKLTGACFRSEFVVG